MARALIARYHGEEAAAAAEERFDTLHVRRELPDEVEEFPFSAANGSVHLPALLPTPSASHAPRGAGCSQAV